MLLVANLVADIGLGIEDHNDRRAILQMGIEIIDTTACQPKLTVLATRPAGQLSSGRSDAHSAGVAAACAVIRCSRASRVSPRCTKAAITAPTSGAIMYSHASVKLPVATIGPSARAGLNAAPVNAPPIMMLSVSVIPIASGARLPARPATAVLSTAVTRKKASTASITNPAAGVIVTVVAPSSEIVRELRRTESGGRPAENGPQQQRAGDAANELAHDIADRVADADGAGGEHADGDRRVHVTSRNAAVGKGEDHDGQAVSEGNRGDTVQTGAVADHGARRRRR